MRLIFLGTASGLPTHDRFSQTVVLEVNGELHLIDPGDAASSLMARSALDHRRIRSALITHMHLDHHSGLAQIMKTAMHLKKTTNMQLVLPSEGVSAFIAFLEACYLPLEWLGYDVNVVGITSQQTDLGEHLQVTAHENCHLSVFRDTVVNGFRSPSWQFQSYSFVIDVAEHRIVYSGNLRRELREIASLITPEAILITEMAHLGIEEVLDTIEDKQPKHVFLTHFYPYLEMGELRKAISRRSLDEVVTLTHDGFEVTL